MFITGFKQNLTGIIGGVSIETLKNLLIPLPPLAEQKRIVSKMAKLQPFINEYTTKEQQARELNETFPDQLRKSILQYAVQGKLVPQDPSDELASTLLERIRAEKEQLIKEGKIKRNKHESVIYRRDNSHYEKIDGVERCIDDEIPFEIPESWEWCRLGSISNYVEKKKKINARDANPSIWGLDLEDIEKGGRLLCKVSIGERKSVGDKTVFSAGDVLYSKLRPYLLKILVAPDDGICTSEIVPFHLYGSISAAYVVMLLKSPYVDAKINSMTYGEKMPRVGTETMTSLLVPLPPYAEQERIIAKIDKLLRQIDFL